MVFRRDQLQRTVHTPAKLNLYLEVLDRRDDGYHELETLMVPVGLRDSLTMIPTPAPAVGRGEISLDVCSSVLRAGDRSVDQIPAGTDNLVVRALDLLRERSGCRAGARLRLVKRIPSGAGLGGGSSDCAAALRLGNDVWHLGFTRQQLSALAAELGSDVPFFLYRQASICRGRGERIEPIAGASRFYSIIIKPPIALSTPEVFRAYDSLSPHKPLSPRRDTIGAIVAALRLAQWRELASRMTNALEKPAAMLTPWVESVKEAFNHLDFIGHQLSGSGSSYFGLCRHAAHAHRLATILRARRLGAVFIARSCR